MQIITRSGIAWPDVTTLQSDQPLQKQVQCNTTCFSRVLLKPNPFIYNPFHHIMGTKRREKALAKSIQAGLLRDPDRFKKSAWGSFLAFFTFQRIKLIRHEQHLFEKLRREVWGFDESEYQASFRTTSGQPPLKMMGDLGYSGSVGFFHLARR